MPYSELKPGRLRFEDESTGNARLLIQDSDELKYADGAGTLIQLLSNIKSGVKADRPSASLKGRIYFATDTGEWFYDDGSAWHRIACGGDYIGDADLDTKFETERSADEDIIRAKAGGQDIFEGYSSGIFSLVKQSDVRMHISAAQSIPNDTWTKVEYDTVDVDVQGEADTTNHRVTVTKSGKYLITIEFQFATNSTGVRRMRLYKNGSVLTHFFGDWRAGSSEIENLVQTMRIIANAGDYFEAYAYQNSGAALNLNYAQFIVTKII